MTKKIQIAKLFHESNSLNPRLTPGTDFEVFHGDEVLTHARGSGTTLGGIVGELEAGDAEIVPVVSVNGSPSGLVEHEFYETIREMMVVQVLKEQPAAIALELHGAMATGNCDDVEGDLLESLRKVAGPSVVIGAELKLAVGG